MDPVTLAIVGALVSGVRTIGEGALVDMYDGLKTLIRRKFGENGRLARAVERLEADPNHVTNRELLAQYVAQTKAAQDVEILEVSEALRAEVRRKARLDAARSIPPPPTSGRWPSVASAGDLLPDGRLTPHQIFRGDEPEVDESSKTERPGRDVNAWLDATAPPPRVGVPSSFWVDISSARSDRLSGVPFAEPDWRNHESLTLVLTLSGPGAVVTPSRHRGILYKDRDFAPVCFTVTPRREGLLTLSLAVYLANELTLLQEFDLVFFAAAVAQETTR